MNTNYDDLIRFSPDGLIHDNERLVELQRFQLQKESVSSAKFLD